MTPVGPREFENGKDIAVVELFSRACPYRAGLEQR